MSAWEIIHGDSAAILPTMASKSVDHVITDPPYEAQAHTLQRRVKRPGARANDAYRDSRVAEVEPLSFAPITEAERDAVSREIGRLASRWAAVFCQVEATQRWRAALECAGLRYMRTGVWVKPDGQPQLSGDRPGMGYESIVFTHAAGRSRWNGGGRTGVFIHTRDQGKAPHPTTKPIALMLELVELFTDPGDLVLDPFAGSGTTGVACIRLGRRFIGIEKDAEYARVARERLEAESRGLSLSAARAGQRSLFG